MFGQTTSSTVKRDLERAGESIKDGDFSGAGHDLSKAAGHTGDLMGGQNKTISEKSSDTVNSTKDSLTSAGHSVTETYHEAVQKVEHSKLP